MQKKNSTQVCSLWKRCKVLSSQRKHWKDNKMAEIGAAWCFMATASCLLVPYIIFISETFCKSFVSEVIKFTAFSTFKCMRTHWDHSIKSKKSGLRTKLVSEERLLLWLQGRSWIRFFSKWSFLLLQQLKRWLILIDKTIRRSHGSRASQHQGKRTTTVASSSLFCTKLLAIYSGGSTGKSAQVLPVSTSWWVLSYWAQKDGSINIQVLCRERLNFQPIFNPSSLIPHQRETTTRGKKWRLKEAVIDMQWHCQHWAEEQQTFGSAHHRFAVIEARR